MSSRHAGVSPYFLMFNYRSADRNHTMGLGPGLLVESLMRSFSLHICWLCLLWPGVSAQHNGGLSPVSRLIPTLRRVFNLWCVDWMLFKSQAWWRGTPLFWLLCESFIMKLQNHVMMAFHWQSAERECHENIKKDIALRTDRDGAQLHPTKVSVGVQLQLLTGRLSKAKNNVTFCRLRRSGYQSDLNTNPEATCSYCL